MIGRPARSPLLFPILALLMLLEMPIAASAAKLCMLPADFPFGASDARRDRVERRVAQAFEDAAIDVASSAEVKRLFAVVEARSGRIYDRDSGLVDPGREAAHLADLERSARDALGCGGFVQVGLHQVFAWYDGEHAAWDGRRTSVVSQGRIAGQVVMGALTGIVVYEKGWIPALSLSIRVTDLRRADVAFRLAGVEPLMSLDVPHGREILPPERWLQDDARIEAAIAAALGPELVDLKTNGRPGDVPLPPGFRWE